MMLAAPVIKCGKSSYMNPHRTEPESNFDLSADGKNSEQNRIQAVMDLYHLYPVTESSGYPSLVNTRPASLGD